MKKIRIKLLLAALPIFIATSTLPFFPLLFSILFILVAFLFFLFYLNYEIVSPLEKLLQAIEGILVGKHEKVVLPKMGARKDEIALLVHGFEEMVAGLQEREKIRSVLNKVVSTDVAEKILKNKLDLGGEDCMVTMLFSDIRDFTTLTEHFSPQKTIEMLNFYMTKMSRIIENEGGIIDKYVGDEIMALFGTPIPHPQHALRAISTGMLMLERIKGVNEERAKRDEPIFKMGIGIHTGVVVAGNMGAENRMNYTVLGKNVNLAARLCQSARPGQLIISENTLEEAGVKDSFIVKSLEPISLKGFSEQIKIYEVTGFQWKKD